MNSAICTFMKIVSVSPNSISSTTLTSKLSSGQPLCALSGLFSVELEERLAVESRKRLFSTKSKFGISLISICYEYHKLEIIDKT